MNIQPSNYVFFSPVGSSGAPNSTGNTCSLTTEDVDVSQLILILKNIFKKFKHHFFKCFGVCGCGYNGKCNYCNSDYFVGYNKQNSKNLPSTPIGAPNSNGNTCLAETEYVDVSFFISFRVKNRMWISATKCANFHLAFRT